MTDTRKELRQLIAKRAYKDGSHFKTPSKIVEAYFDFLEISLKHQGVKLAGDLLYEEIKDLDICALGGPGHGITSVLCRAAFLREIGVFYIRESTKTVGDLQDPRWLESRIKEGDRVALAADVVLSGSLVTRAVEEVMQFGGQVVKIVILIDSQDGDGVKKIRRFLTTNMMDIPVTVLFTREQILG
jgi:orotate phosphoribosyltransferase